MTEANPEECAEHALANLIHWRDMGLVMPYYSIYNEPGWFQGKTTRSGEFLRDVIKILGPKMRSLGFQTEIIIPDEVEAASAARKAATILSDPVARQYVGKIATHLYGNKISQMQDLKQVSEEYKVPLWMTEFSVYALDTTDFTRRDFVGWAAFMHEMISTYNTSAILYMWSTFGQWDGSRTMLVQINNNANNYVGYTPMKSLYSTAQFSKFIRPGSVRTKALGGSSEVLVSSYKLGGTSVVVAINLSGSSKTITVNLGSLGSGVSQIFPSRTSASENTVQLQSIPVVNTSFQTSLPANSITTFTTDASAY